MTQRSFTGCALQILKEESFLQVKEVGTQCSVDIVQDINNQTCLVQVRCGDISPNFQVTGDTNHFQIGGLRYLVHLPQFCYSIVITFSKQEEMMEFKNLLSKASQNMKSNSVFSERTDKASAARYFKYYGTFAQQQNMLQDYVRTATYQKAMLQNRVDFEDKVVIDVGAGSGILSFFAVQAGAKKVYAIEASNMAQNAELLVKKNNLEGKIIIVPDKVEEVDIPEQVDMIISEPMGYMLYNERMLESYLHAKKWLKPGGNMFPTRGDLHIAPFSDEALYNERLSKASFWENKSFHGVDLSSVYTSAFKEFFVQPVKGTFDVSILMAKPNTHTVDFLTSEEDDLHRINIPVQFTILNSGSLHGLAFWFDVVFQGSQQPVLLSTAPDKPLTHWYQIRSLLQKPIMVQTGQVLTGTVLMITNDKQSYDVEIDLSLEGTAICSKSTFDMKNPYFKLDTESSAQLPFGVNNMAPTGTN